MTGGGRDELFLTRQFELDRAAGLQSGESQSATVNAAVTTAPSVLVTDAHGNPVQGVSVTFAVASGGGSVTGATATTGADGVATVGPWTLGAFQSELSSLAPSLGGVNSDNDLGAAIPPPNLAQMGVGRFLAPA